MKIEVKNLPDICTITTGKYDANHAVQNGKYRFYTCSSQYSYCDTCSFSGEAVIVPGNGDIGLVFYYDGNFEAYQRTYVLTDISINAKYLYYHLLYKWRHYNERKKMGSTVKYVRKANFENYVISFPEEEMQKKIVARIEELFSELDNAVETLKTTKQQLEVYRQAVYIEAYSSFSNMRPITEFFDISGGLTKNSERNNFSIKMPYLRVANVYYDKLDLTEVKEIGVEKSEIEKTSLKADDLLFVEGNGSKSQIGRVAIWDGSIPKCLHQNHIIKGRPIGNMLSRFALYYLISREGRKQIVEVAKSTSGLYTLSTNKVKNLMVPVCDLQEQKNILNKIDSNLSVLMDIEKTVDNTLSQAEALRQSILKEAFEGRLI